MINRIITVLMFVVLFLGCKSVTENQNIKKIEFGTDIIIDEETAVAYAELIFKSRYINTNFEVTKPFEIQSIDNNKVWYVIAEDKRDVIKKNSYHIKILKNTGQVIDIWRIH